MNMLGGATSTAGKSLMGYYSGDFNGDGNTDVIQPWDNGGKLGIMVHNVSSGNSTIIYDTTFNNVGSGNVGFVPADMNGDGKTDLIQGCKNGDKLALSVFLSNGTTFNNSWNATTTNGSGNLGLLPVDIDGDGKIDIVQL